MKDSRASRRIAARIRNAVCLGQRTLGVARWCLLGCCVAWMDLRGEAPNSTRAFLIPAGEASETLRVFGHQAGVRLLYSAEAIGTTRTNAVRGDLSPRAALELLLAETGLAVAQPDNANVITIVRVTKSTPNAEPKKKRT